MLPQIRFLRAAIGPRGNIVGLPVRKDGPRVMSSATASSVLQALRGPVKRGTARSANSSHALVYGKTGTSSRNEDALFVGLTQDFVGSIWLGHDRPAPMPGVHGGGMPAKSFSKLTDFYYVRLAQARYADKRGDGGLRFALGQTEDFRRKAAWDHRHDRAWLAGGVMLLCYRPCSAGERGRRERSPSSRRMKIATFNINNINKRLPNLLAGWRRPSRTSSACRS